MNPISSLTDSELDEACAVEVHGWYEKAIQDSKCWYDVDRNHRECVRQYRPTSNDAQGLAVFDEAAKRVGAGYLEINRIHFAGSNLWEAIMRPPMIGFEVKDVVACEAATRPRALCECAILAVRTFNRGSQ